MPKRPHGEALVRVLSAGICNTDIEIARADSNVAQALRSSFLLAHQVAGRLRGGGVQHHPLQLVAAQADPITGRRPGVAGGGRLYPHLQ